MIARLVEISLVQRILLCALGLALLFGGLYSFHLLDIIAYPDPSPPMVELITQNPGWSAEEIERQITIPIEVALTGMPGLTDIRSLSIFGLSDIKVYFDFRNTADAGFDVIKEAKQLGANMICELHMKENGFLLDEGTLNWQQIGDALYEMNYTGDRWMQIEWAMPKDAEVVAAYKHNLQFLQTIFNKA